VRAPWSADLATASPSLPLDGLYGVLGLLLGVNAANERSALTQVLQQRQEPQQQQKDEDSDSGTCG
jgi:membrane protease subunit (stomatin/prohibitin family)